MKMKFFFTALISLLLFACSLLEHRNHLHNECLPVTFDHIFFKIDEKSYQEVGKSDFFNKENIGFFEPFKNPFGSHIGHYLTGEHHYLEFFSDNLTNVESPLGIGFFSEKIGCMEQIQKTLDVALPGMFIRSPKENWGAISQLKESSLWVWVYEPTEEYVGNSNIDKYHYLRRIRRQNGDQTESYRFQNISEINFQAPHDAFNNLILIFKTLGWIEKSNNVFELKGTIDRNENNFSQDRVLNYRIA